MAQRLPTSWLLRRGLSVLRQEVAMHPRPFALGVLGAAVYAGATVASSWVLGRAVDQLVVPRFRGGDMRWGAVLAGAAAIVAVGLVKAAGIVGRRIGAGRTEFRVEATLRTRVVDEYLRRPVAWHQAHPSGELLAHATSDVQACAEILAPLPFATGVVTLLVGTAAWMFVTDPFMAGVGLLLLPVLVAVNLVAQRVSERPAADEQERIGRVTSVAHESFDGAQVVKAFGAEDLETDRFAAVAAELRDAKVRVGVLRGRFEALLDAVPALGTVAVLLVGAARVRAGAMSTGDLVAFVNLLSLLVWPLRLIGYVLGSFPRTVAGWERLVAAVGRAALTGTDPAEDGGGTGTVPERRDGSLPAGPLDVQVRGVAFSYTPGTPVLSGVDLDIPAGSRVALVGPTGAGKSTLLQLLARLREPDEGTIAVGGVDLTRVDAAELSRAVALVFQEPFLFGDSVAENIRLGATVDRAALEEAGRAARVDEFTEALPSRYDTAIGERGATLSGGQRQRIALARALVRRPRLLLLDDATSSVDPATEGDILARLAEALGGATLLLVATRPSTIALADEVVFLAGGQVVARGGHEDLLRAVPAYAQLVRAYETAAVTA